MLIFGLKMLVQTIILDYTYCSITYPMMQVKMVYILVNDTQSIYELTWLDLFSSELWIQCVFVSWYL
jgi:hypothetical protein